MEAMSSEDTGMISSGVGGVTRTTSMITKLTNSLIDSNKIFYETEKSVDSVAFSFATNKNK